MLYILLVILFATNYAIMKIIIIAVDLSLAVYRKTKITLKCIKIKLRGE